MHPPTARAPFHLLRASAVAACMLGIAAGAHIAAGGLLPAPSLMIGVLSLTGLAASAATKLKLSFPAMCSILGLGGGQFVLHGFFAAFGVGAPAAAPGVSAHHADVTGWPASLAQGPLSVHLQSTHQAALDSHADGAAAALMLAAHILATVACALLLAKGESALWALAAWLRPLTQLPAPVPRADPTPAPGRPGAPVAAPPWRNLRRDVGRGPPPAVVLSCT